MGDEKSKTHLSTWNRRQEFIIVASSLAIGILLPLQICVPMGNQSFTSPH
jgi:hypothetical protein